MYDQFVDLTVPLDERFLLLLNDDQKVRLKNAYYAKHGYILKDQGLNAYYRKHYWYKEIYESPEDAEKLMTDTDRENINMIVESMK